MLPNKSSSSLLAETSSFFNFIFNIDIKKTKLKGMINYNLWRKMWKVTWDNDDGFPKK